MNLVNSNDTESTNDNIPKIEDWMTEKKKTTRGWIIKILLASVLGIILIWSISYVSRPEPIEVDGGFVTINGPFEDKDIEIVLPKPKGVVGCEIWLSPAHKLEEGQRLHFVSQECDDENEEVMDLRMSDGVLKWTESIDVLGTHRVKINSGEGTELPLKRITAVCVQLEGVFNELEMIEVCLDTNIKANYSFDKENCLDGEFPSLETLEITTYETTKINGNFPRLNSVYIFGHNNADGNMPWTYIEGDFPVLDSLRSYNEYTELRGKFPALKCIDCFDSNDENLNYYALQGAVRLYGGSMWDNLTKIRAGVLQMELLDTSYPKLAEIECNTINFAVDSSKLAYSGDFPNYNYNIPENTAVFANEIKKTMPVLKEVTVRDEATNGFNVIEEALVRLADDGIITLNLLYK